MGVKQVEWNFPGNYMITPFMTEIIELLLTSCPLYIGAVPDSLAATIERLEPEANSRPSKRRKLGSTGPRSLAQVHGVSESGIPNGYIPLARLSLHLVGSNSSVEACGWTNTLSPLEFRECKPKFGRVFRFLCRPASPISCPHLKGLELARFLRVSSTRN